jgi:cell division septal protein FtsQ
MNLRTDIPFTLPRGYVDASGLVHQTGRMRLATALDEIESYQDPRVQANEAYLPVVLFSRVIVQLGALPAITVQVIEGLFASDLAYLEDLYQRLNSPGRVTLGVVCPQCGTQFQVQVAPLQADE